MILKKSKAEDLIRAWCYLDNRFGYLDSLKAQKKYSTNESTYQLLHEESIVVDYVRTLIMNVWNFNDYDNFVKYVVSGYAKWDDKLNCWHLNSDATTIKDKLTR